MDNSGVQLRLCTPLDLHSSQTRHARYGDVRWLCTPLDLHSSQTSGSVAVTAMTLCTPLDLHSSQTCVFVMAMVAPLCTPLDLHSSQTQNCRLSSQNRALYPSGFTQLSNSFRIKFYLRSFVPLWIYTALKLVRRLLHERRQLCTPLDLHSSQTHTMDGDWQRWLCTPLDLHSSQTSKSEKPAQPAGVHPEGSPVHFYYSTSGGKGNPSGPYGGPCGGAGGACAAASCARSSHRSSSSSTRRSPGSRG